MPGTCRAFGASGSSPSCWQLGIDRVLTNGRKNGQRIHACAVHPNSPVKMRTGHPSGRADLSNRLASSDQVALMDVHDRQVREQRKHAEAVIDDDRVAGEIEIPREQNASAVRRMNGSAGGAQKVRAAVRLPRLTVEDATRAKRPVRPAGDRSNEAEVPQTPRLGLRPEVLDLDGLALDARDCRVGWIDVSLVNLQDPFAECPRRNVELGCRRRGASDRRGLERYLVRP